MPARKSSPSKRPSPRALSTVVVDELRLDRLAKEARTPSKRVGKAPPPLPRPAGRPARETIEVDSRWLIPAIPERDHPKKGEEPRKALPLPSILAVKPRGKLPPPIPREDHESAELHPRKSPERGGRPSKRPPRAR